jgi:protein-disulfide isomerase
MHDAIFEAQAEWRGRGDEARSVFAAMASDLDLDGDAFSTCMDGDSQMKNLQANVEEARSLGVDGTPFFFIDGYGLSGAQPYELFEMAVELAEKDELDDVIEAQARQAYEIMLAQQAALPRQELSPPTEPVAVPLDDAYSVGDPSAPVTIVEYTDYQCPYCARHALQTFAQIEESMVERGEVRYFFKDMPLTSIHPQAMLAAEAARCAGAQEPGREAFVAMHNMLFEKQRAWSGQSDAGDLFADYAAEIGLDAGVFAACLQNHEFESAVEADLQEAMELGFRGTPAFLVNGQPVSGALPFEAFEQIVANLLDESSAQAVSD